MPQRAWLGDKSETLFPFWRVSAQPGQHHVLSTGGLKISGCELLQ
jgi:hypothetical protein